MISSPTLERRRPTRCSLAVALAAALLLGSPAASAVEPPPPAPPGESTAMAQTLFEEARRLMEAQRYAEVCPKLEESLRLRPGTGTLLNLALCNEAIGKTATAWAQFKEVLFAAKKEGNQAREAFAKEHIDALEPRLSRLEVHAEPTPGLAIRRDGQEMPAAALGTPIPVDPGEHTLEATAPGYTVWSTSFQIEPESRPALKQVAIPKLTPLAAPGKPAAAARPPAAADAPPDGRRIAGIVIGVAGVAAVGLGAVFGSLAAAEKSDAEEDPALCPAMRCSPAGREAIDAASTKALVSTFGIGVGLAAIGAGAVLILTSRPGTPAAEAREAPLARLVPSFGPGGGGLQILGAF
jgi:hypothetical protein